MFHFILCVANVFLDKMPISLNISFFLSNLLRKFAPAVKILYIYINLSYHYIQKPFTRNNKKVYTVQLRNGLFFQDQLSLHALFLIRYYLCSNSRILFIEPQSVGNNSFFSEC